MYDQHLSRSGAVRGAHGDERLAAPEPRDDAKAHLGEVEVELMDMRLDSLLAPQQSTMITYRQIAAVRLLQLSSQDLEAAIAREEAENPAFEAATQSCCLRCNSVLAGPGLPCPGCGSMPSVPGEHASAGVVMDGGYGAGSSAWEDDSDDPMMRVPAGVPRGESVLQALRCQVSGDDVDIAEYLVECLDSHGFLPATIVEDAADVLHVDAARVERVLACLQGLDPVGIGARGARECLLIQLRRLAEAGEPHPLAERLVREFLKDLAFRHFREIAHAVGVMPKKIEAEWAFIRSRLNPYPAHGFDGEGGTLALAAAPVRPDVIIRGRDGGFTAEVVERQRYVVRVSEDYLWLRKNLAGSGCSDDERVHVRAYVESAQSFISALKQRWETMQRVADALLDLQREYLLHGQSALKPLTRADVARCIGVHESTVSRATDGKYVLLPNGHTVPFDDFFDSSLPVKKTLRELIGQENARKPYSDEQLTQILQNRGFDVARRTIAKYREEMGILPSRLRKQRPPTRRRARQPRPAEMRAAVAAR